MFKCKICETDCRPTGTNVVGMEIQEFVEKEGWVSTEKVYKSECEARNVLKHIGIDNIKRRIYAVFERRQFSKFEEKV